MENRVWKMEAMQMGDAWPWWRVTGDGGIRREKQKNMTQSGSLKRSGGKQGGRDVRPRKDASNNKNRTKARIWPRPQSDLSNPHY